MQSREVVEPGRIDPEYFDPRVVSVASALAALGSRPLGDWVTSANRGVAPDYDPNGAVRVVKTATVRRAALVLEGSEYVSTGFAESNRRALIPKGAVLVTATGVGSAGRAFLNLRDEKMLADAHVTILRPVDTNSAAFLCAFLQSPIGRQQLLRQRRGSSRQIEIYPEDIEALLVPEVPARLRDAISARWLESIQRVEATENAVYEAEKQVTQLIEQHQAPATGDHTGWGTQLVDIDGANLRIDPEHYAPEIRAIRCAVTNCSSASLSDIIVRTRKGLQPSEYFDDGPVTVIKTKDVRFPDFDLDGCDKADDESWPFFLKGGEVVLNMTGQGSLGRAGVVPKIPPGLKVIPSVDLQVLEVDSERILPEYLALFLNSPPGRKISVAQQTGSSGQQHLYPPHFAGIPIPLPQLSSGEIDLDWQRQLVDRITERWRALDSARLLFADLDDEFLELLGIPVDLSVVPF